MGPIDAHLAAEKIKNSDLPNHWKDAFLSCLSGVPTIAPPPNAPLTLEELLEIYATDPYRPSLKPVWIEIKKDMPYSLGSRCSGYDLIGIDDSHPDFAISICDRFLHMKSYGEYWLSYRYKKEG